jgi:hypothetical protein
VSTSGSNFHNVKISPPSGCIPPRRSRTAAGAFLAEHDDRVMALPRIA